MVWVVKRQAIGPGSQAVRQVGRSGFVNNQSITQHPSPFTWHFQTSPQTQRSYKLAKLYDFTRFLLLILLTLSSPLLLLPRRQIVAALWPPPVTITAHDERVARA